MYNKMIFWLHLCGKCGEAFRYMSELEYHGKSHLKQKGYKCDCGRTFNQYTDLLYHHHPGEDPDVEAYVPMPAEPAGPIVPSPSQPAIDPAAFPTPEFKEKGYEPKYAMTNIFPVLGHTC
ncbi:zinc finger protein unc-98 [Ditylenchus destructor]|nr:zinc finger protein unc-98 [Ditylenchus destructor]